MAIRWMLFLSLATILISCAAQKEGAEPEAEVELESYVLTLDSTNFSEALSKHPFMVVKFYSPRCGRCVRFAPEYEKAAASLKNHDPPIVFAKVDVYEQSNKPLAKEYEVRAYPSLKIIQNGGENVENYEGREANDLVEYLKKQVAETKAEAEAETETEIKVETETETEVKAEAETEAEVKAKTKTEVEAETETGVKAKAETEAEVKAKTKTEVEAETETEAKTETEVKAKAKTEAKAEVETEVESYVLTLDSTNFSEALTKHPFIVVKFYAPWCGHCKRLAPEYEKAATSLKNHDPPIVLAKVDANEKSNKALAGEYEVRGYPTLKIIRNGGENIENYKGPREANGIVEYLKAQAAPTSLEIKTSEWQSS